MSQLNTSQLNSTSPCYPLLFQLGALSYEPQITPNTTICPDSIFTPIISSISTFLCLVMILFSVPMIFIKRKSGHIINRNIIFISVDLIINSYFALNTGLRYIVGRRNFPCLIYSITFFVIPPSIFLPNILKCWRLFSLDKINSIISITLNESLDNLKTNESANQVNISTTRQQATDQIAIDKSLNIPKESSKQLSPQQKRLISILRFSTSNAFSIIFYVFIILFHLVLWLICGGIDLATPGKKLFLTDGKLLDPKAGCTLGLGSIIVVAGQCAVYLVVELIVLGLCFYSDRDTWKIKKETIVCAAFQLLSSVLFAVLGNIDFVKYFVDNLVPYGNVLVFYSIFAIFVSVVLPIFYSIREDRKKSLDLESNMNGDVEQFLKNQENYEKILDFARRSFCPENLLCWRDIQRFKKSFHNNENLEESIRIGKGIVESYLKASSMAQINLSAELSVKVEEIEIALNSNNVIDQNLFESIQNHCLIDIQCDVYSRFTTVKSNGSKNQSKHNLAEKPSNQTTIQI